MAYLGVQHDADANALELSIRLIFRCRYDVDRIGMDEGRTVDGRLRGAGDFGADIGQVHADDAAGDIFALRVDIAQILGWSVAFNGANDQ